MSDTEAGEVSRAPDSVISAVLWKAYPEPVGPLLDGFRVTCRQGEVIVVLGASGCGKTTILSLLSGLDPADRISGAALSAKASVGGFAYAFQRAELIPWRNCEDNAYFETDVLGMERSAVRQRVDSLMRVTNLDPYRRLFPHQLSLGMQQRLQVVRVFARRANVFLLDEPLGAVDQPLRLTLAEELRRLVKLDKAGAVWVTHDTLEAVTAADRVLIVGGRPLTVSSDQEVRRAATSLVTFEVDALSQETHSGWSVLVRGLAEEVTEAHDPKLVERTKATAVTPWAEGRREHWMRLIPHKVTGRRIVPRALNRLR